MSLKSKIEKIILAIKDSNISEIEITNFWGAQKIKLKTKNFIKEDLIKNEPENPKPRYDENTIEEVDKAVDIETKSMSISKDLLDNEELSSFNLRNASIMPNA